MALNGIRMRAYPTGEQRSIFAQWMGCSRVIWNAKCEEERYKRVFAKKYLPVGTYPDVNQTYSQYKDPELTPWLSDCPSQILRNTATNWYRTYKHFLSGHCRRPKRKRARGTQSVHLTRELFRFEKDEYQNLHLFIGTKRNAIGRLSFKQHRAFEIPASIRIIRDYDRWFVSFSYEDLALSDHHDQVGLDDLRECKRNELEEIVLGIDRGVKRPLQLSSGDWFQPSDQARSKARARERYRRRMARSISRGSQGSKRQRKKRQKMQRLQAKQSNIRRDFNHKASRTIIDHKPSKVLVLEDLKTKQMTKRSKPKKCESTDQWIKSGARAKSGLNASILDQGWGQFEIFLNYKAARAGKLVVKVAAHHTSQECADCGHIHPSNRKNQATFKCCRCGYSENADVNASRVIKKRAINLILDPGTGLSSRGVLQDIGRGASCKTAVAQAVGARSHEASKKKAKARAA